jgi:formate-nitrite transporter family protein
MKIQDDANLDNQEKREVDKRAKLRAPVVYSIIRQEGEEELSRPAVSLFWSGIAAGIVMSTSVLAEGLLHHFTPPTRSQELFVHFGYCVGFIIVVLGRMQLFTENTITAVLPVVAKFSRQKLYQLARIWALVFVANMVGIALAMGLWVHGGIVGHEAIEGMAAVSRSIIGQDFLTTLGYGVPAGFLVAVLVWMMPSARNSQFAVITLITYMIALGGFSHVVAGSGKAFLLWYLGEASLGFVVGGFMIPALIGNLIGGTGLFTMLAYAQVREELED